MNKTQLKALAKRYKEAYNTLLSGFPAWKRKAIIEDLKLDKDNGYVQNFVSAVILQAEQPVLLSGTKKPVVGKNAHIEKQPESVGT